MRETLILLRAQWAGHMHLTVAICTWNRARLLDRALDSLSQMHVPPGVEWEVLVVNNNSTDETESVTRRHMANLPLRLIAEPRQGKSFALNTAMDAARGAVVVWTDDDVLVDAGWLSAYAATARDAPEHAFWGGPIEPLFETLPPCWVEAWPAAKLLFAACDFGSEPLELCPKRLALGANFAVRTEVQRQFRYDTQLGRTASTQLGGEELDVQLRMLQAGWRGGWVPSARVRHVVPSERFELDFLRRFFHGLGCTAALMKDKAAQPCLRRLTRRLSMRWKVMAYGAKYWAAKHLTNSPSSVKYLAKSSYLKGRLSRSTW
jgi:glycosyltransferase involved in cell wall biosynthesis